MVALLRGINVGGRTSLPMSDLRALAQGLGYDDVATHIQSGNLLCRTTRSAVTVASELAAALAARPGVSPDVIVRTRAQLAKVAAGNPFLADGADPAHLHVLFGTAPASRALASINGRSYLPEQARAVGKELYLHLPNGVGRSKLAVAVSQQGTVRSWKTVSKLLELAQGMA